MNFIHHTLDQPKDIQIKFTLEETPELFDDLTKFLNIDETMDMQVAIEYFEIQQSVINS